jgi:hypothetical protein
MFIAFDMGNIFKLIIGHEVLMNENAKEIN